VLDESAVALYVSLQSYRIELRDRQRPHATTVSLALISQALAIAFSPARLTQKVRRLPHAMQTGTRPITRPSKGASWRFSNRGIVFSSSQLQLDQVTPRFAGRFGFRDIGVVVI
jgi:hypothetical protein